MLQQIATELGAEYQQTNEHCHRFTIPGTWDDPPIKVYAHTRRYGIPDGMIVYGIDTSYQSKWWGTYRGDDPEIKISGKKPPSQIAKEIKRRLLTPENIAKVKRVFKSVLENDRHTNRRIKLMQSAGEILGQQWEPKRIPEQMYPGNVANIVTIRPGTPDNLEVTFKNITPEQLGQIKAILEA